MSKPPLDALEAEATVEDGTVPIDLDGQTIHVLPTKQWRLSGAQALRAGDYETWSRKCLTPESADLWAEIDPTIQQAEDFFVDYNEATGQDPGKSRASSRSSRSTARR